MEGGYSCRRGALTYPFLSEQARAISFAFPDCPEQEDFLACLLPSLDCTEIKPGCLLLKCWTKFRRHGWDLLSHTTSVSDHGHASMHPKAETFGYPSTYHRRQHSEIVSLNTYWAESNTNQRKLFPLSNDLTLWHWCGSDHVAAKVWDPMEMLLVYPGPRRSRASALENMQIFSPAKVMICQQLLIGSPPEYHKVWAFSP